MALRILVVDDSPVMRSFIRRVLGLTGLEIETTIEAGDGQEALEVLDREWVDLIFTDINMPRMNGEEFVRRLSDSGVTATLPVVVISTDGTVVRKEMLAGLGARAYLQKPFSPEQLRDEVERVLEVPHVH
jgi:two-component system chemotaxis response regulator CheY